MIDKNKKIIQRINRVTGQLEGIKKMLESEKVCTDVLIQFKAANSALENAMKVFAKDSIGVCFEKLNKKNAKKELEKLLESLIK